MPGQFEGKRVVVCGLAEAGRACVDWFLEAGARVGMVDPDATVVAKELAPRAEGRLVPMDAESDDWLAIERWGRRWLETEHRLDLLVNSHMAVDFSGVEDADVESVQRVVGVNLVGPLACARAFLPALKVPGEAAIVNIGSIHGEFGFPKMVAYSMSKGGLVPLTHVMAHEFAPYGIRVNCIARAGLMNPGDEGNGSGVVDPVRMFGDTPLGRAARPEEFGSVVAFLGSPASSYITGTTLTVDGGRTAVTRGML
jgi:NAD(P)-dependent dehydrogenase (short-subunit alcohol dehydrogenase family)